jgi:hypothetical protein
MVILMGFQKTTEINVYVKPDSFGLYFKAWLQVTSMPISRGHVVLHLNLATEINEDKMWKPILRLKLKILEKKGRGETQYIEVKPSGKNLFSSTLLYLSIHTIPKSIIGSVSNLDL